MLRSHADHPENREPEPTPTPTPNGNTQPAGADGPPKYDFEQYVFDEAAEMPEDILTGVIERGTLGMLFGTPGHGKSNVCLIEMLALATNRSDMLPTQNKVIGGPYRVGFAWCDEPKKALNAKMRAAKNHYNIKQEHIAGRLFDLRMPNGRAPKGFLSTLAHIEVFRKVVLLSKCQVIYIDSLATVSPDAEVSNEKGGPISSRLADLAEEIDGGIILLHHSRKGPVAGGKEIDMDAKRGASSIDGNIRTMRQIVKKTADDPNNNRFEIVDSKISYSQGQQGKVVWQSIPVFPGEGSKKSAPVFQPAKEVSPFDDHEPKDLVNAVDHLLKQPMEFRRADPQSAKWAGVMLGDSLKLNVGHRHKNKRSKEQSKDRDNVNAMINKLVKNDILKSEKMQLPRADGKGKTDFEYILKGSEEYTI